MLPLQFQMQGRQPFAQLTDRHSDNPLLRLTCVPCRSIQDTARPGDCKASIVTQILEEASFCGCCAQSSTFLGDLFDVRHKAGR